MGADRLYKSLEQIFGGKLNCSWIAAGRAANVENRARVNRAEEAAVGPDAGRLIVVLQVERILHFHAKFEGMIPGQVSDFAEAQVDDAVATETEEVTADITELAGSRRAEQFHLSCGEIV